MNDELSGGCLCGYIRFHAMHPQSPHTCSCDICQKHSGSHTVVWLEFAAEDVTWTGEGGKPALYRSSATSSRAFCCRCGSSVGAIDDGPTVALLTGLFDQHPDDDFTPEFHAFDDMKPDWWRRICPDSPA